MNNIINFFGGQVMNFNFKITQKHCHNWLQDERVLTIVVDFHIFEYWQIWLIILRGWSPLEKCSQNLFQVWVAELITTVIIKWFKYPVLIYISTEQQTWFSYMTAGFKVFQKVKQPERKPPVLSWNPTFLSQVFEIIRTGGFILFYFILSYVERAVTK